jgi:hypothetical protein
MNLRRRIEKIERRVSVDVQSQNGADPLLAVDALLATPVDKLAAGEPELDPNALRIYLAFVLAHLVYAGERPEVYSQADLDEWQARREHAESLVEALERQDPACDVRAAAESSKRVWLTGLRQVFTGEATDQIPM